MNLLFLKKPAKTLSNLWKKAYISVQHLFQRANQCFLLKWVYLILLILDFLV